MKALRRLLRWLRRDPVRDELQRAARLREGARYRPPVRRRSDSSGGVYVPPVYGGDGGGFSGGDGGGACG